MNNSISSELNPTVLIVDDSSLSRKIIADLLNGEGFHIIFGKGGKEAIEILSETQVDCLLLDLLMPDFDGFDVLDIIQKNNIRVPSIVISADIQDTTRKQVESLGAFGFLYKPPQKDETIKAIKDAISHKYGG